MKLGISFSKESRSKQTRPNQQGRLHAVAGQFLVYLLGETQRLEEGTPTERETIRNRGVKWEPSKVAEALGISPAQLNHMRERLTSNGLIVSTASGTGTGRRVKFVRLVGDGIKEAECFRDHQMSQYRRKREFDRMAGIWRAEEQEIAEKEYAEERQARREAREEELARAEAEEQWWADEDQDHPPRKEAS